MSVSQKQTKFSNEQSRFYDVNPPVIPWHAILAKKGFTCLYKPREIFWKRALDTLEMKKGDSVLEVGCGLGLYLSRLSRHYSVSGTGIDISEKSIEYATENYGNKHLLFQKADATDLPFPDFSFDFLISFDALEHISDQKMAVKEMCRVLKRGGKMLIYTLSKNDKYTLDWLWEKLGFDTYARAAHKRELFVDPDWLKERIESEGLKVQAFYLFDAFFTLALDELVMIKAFFCRKLGFYKNDAIGLIFLGISSFFSKMLYRLFVYLDNFWFKKGYSLSFLIVAKKSAK